MTADQLRERAIAGTVRGLGGVLLVGESNPYGSHPRFALYPRPERASGNRLRRILGLQERTYLALHRTNLCSGKWAMREARRRAGLLVADRAAPWRVIVLLGRRVGQAFGFGGAFFSGERRDEFFLISLPHPSGLNRLWNKPGAVERARRILLLEAPAVPWGEVEDDF